MTHKKIITLLVLGSVIIAAGVSFFLSRSSAPEKHVVPVPVVESVPEVKPEPEKDVFVTGIPPGRFDSLELTDFPSTQSQNLQTAAMYRDHIFISSNHHILEYDRAKNLIRETDSRVIDCPDGLPSMLITADDTLYATCDNDGVYEIDLARNRVAYHFDLTNGLTNVHALDPYIVGNVLWVGTSNGLAKIDRTTRQVRMFSQELGGNCDAYETTPHVSSHDVWTVIAASYQCAGGAAHYNAQQDSWDFYGPSVFNRRDATRVDFMFFIVGKEDVYATHFDGGTQYGVLDIFDRTKKSWSRKLERGKEALSREMWRYFSSADENLRFVPMEQAEATEWHLNLDGEGGIFLLPHHRYLAMSTMRDGRYFLLSTSGIEQYEKGQLFPEVVVHNRLSGDVAPNVLTSSSGRYVLGEVSESDGTGGAPTKTTVIVYDRETRHIFTNVFGGLPDAQFPTAIMLQGHALLQLVEQGDVLFLTENEKQIIKVDLAKAQITVL